jgi:nucleoid DNA-binding protein
MAKKKTKKKATARKATAKKRSTKSRATKARTAKKRTAKKRTTKAAAPAHKPSRLTAAKKVRTKSEMYNTIADQTGLARKEVVSVFDSLADIMSVDLAKRGPGVVQVPGLMKVVVKRMPATKARKGINPFTKEPTIFKAKPARNVVKVRPLVGLKSRV